jgi:putative hemolysin
MTHRTDVAAVEDTNSIQNVVQLAIEEGYSRIPVYQEDLDTILGVVYVKDLLKYVGSQVNKEMKITDIMRPAYFVPETKHCSELFAEMTERKTQIAIIVDEYGGTEGIITMEDLLEAIVGNIQDEYDHEEQEIFKVSENTFTVDGSTAIDEISSLVGIDLPEGDYDTIAGFVVEMLGRIPKPGEHPSISFENLDITVEDVEDRRITKLLIIKNVIPEQPQEENKD